MTGGLCEENYTRDGFHFCVSGGGNMIPEQELRNVLKIMFGCVVAEGNHLFLQSGRSGVFRATKSCTVALHDLISERWVGH